MEGGWSGRGGGADAQVGRGRVGRVHPSHGTVPSGGPTLAGQVREERYEVREGTETDTDALLASAGMSADEITKLRETGAVK